MAVGKTTKKKTTGKAVTKKTTAKTVAKKVTAKKPAPKKKTVAKKATMKEGSRYVCRVCGLGITVDTACGCVETAHLICCEKPMKPGK